MRIGILGGGQLARMLALAAHPLGLKVKALDPSASACAAAVAPLVCASFDDPSALALFAQSSDVLTFDFENVPAAALNGLSPVCAIRPPLGALDVAQDRLQEKTLFRKLEIPTPSFQAISSAAELGQALAVLQGRAILKTRRLGYDGKGQIRVDRSSDPKRTWGLLAGAPAILEQLVAFDFEVSQLAVRSSSGETRFYPLIANIHRDGVLHLSYSPCDRADLSALAQRHVGALLEQLDYVGLLAVEFFVLKGTLLANEMAPRVHNSGHLTLEGNETSQFENHLRAIAGLPLGSTAARGFSMMLNHLGALPECADALKVDGAHWHDYAKTARPGRKVGHTTVNAPTRAVLQERAQRLGVDELPELWERLDGAAA